MPRSAWPTPGPPACCLPPGCRAARRRGQRLQAAAAGRVALRCASVKEVCTNNATVDDLARQVERLSSDEREELRHRILLMPADDQAEIDAGWVAEAERRLDAIESGEDRPVPWEQVCSMLGLK